jgi:hypothetical protein
MVDDEFEKICIELEIASSSFVSGGGEARSIHGWESAE